MHMSIIAAAQELIIKGNGAFRPATNDELLKLAASIPHVRLHYNSLWSAEDRILDVSFKIPPLKRRLNSSDKSLVVHWLKYHPRWWEIELTLFLEDDDKKPYRDTFEIKTPNQYKLDDLNEFIKQKWIELENSNNARHMRGKEWKAKIVTQRAKKLENCAAQ